MKAVILARVSTARQEKEGLSLQDIQLPTLREYAEDKGFRVVQEFVFSESADQKIRKKFTEMVSYIKQHKDIKFVIAYRVDRITRNFRDAVLVDELIKEHGKEIHFVDDRLVINRDTVGRDIQDWDLKVFLGKQYLNRLKEDGRNSARFKLKRGEWPGKAPFGYDNITKDNKRKWVIQNPFESSIVKYLFETYAAGSISMLALKHKVKKEFELDISKSQIDQILKKKFYMGVMEYDGDEYPHNYEPIITRALYERVQFMKEENGQKGKGIKHGRIPFIYRGLIKCSICGSSISCERKKGKYTYYKCTEYYKKHGAKSITEEDITKQILEAYKQIHIPDDELAKIIKSIKESHGDKKHYNEQLLEGYQAEYKKYANRISRIYEDKLDGLLTASEYQERARDYRDKQTALQLKIDQLQEADDTYYMTAENILNLAARAAEIYESSEIEQKQQILKFTFQNFEFDGEKLIYDWTEPFKKLSFFASRLEWHAR